MIILVILSSLPYCASAVFPTYYKKCCPPLAGTLKKKKKNCKFSVFAIKGRERRSMAPSVTSSLAGEEKWAQGESPREKEETYIKRSYRQMDQLFFFFSCELSSSWKAAKKKKKNEISSQKSEEFQDSVCLVFSVQALKSNLYRAHIDSQLWTHGNRTLGATQMNLKRMLQLFET